MFLASQNVGGEGFGVGPSINSNKLHCLIFSNDAVAGHMVLDTNGLLIRSLQIVRFLHR